MKTLLINGTEYPFRLELGAVRLYAIKKGLKSIKSKEIPEIMSEADMITDYPILIWAGLKAGQDPDNKFNKSVETVRQWLDDDPASFDRAMEMINEDNEVPEFEGKEKAEPETPNE